MRKYNFFLIAFLLAALHLVAQSPIPTGISGVITDGKTPLQGATITIQETKHTIVSDAKGEFSLPIRPGAYTLEINHVGLKTIVRHITVAPSQIVHLNLTLTPESKMLGEVSVQATRKATTVRALLENRRASTNIEDAIGAIQIEKSASINTAQALQRVTGVTVKDGKYITVRGLSDRNVVVQLNGSRLASADAGRSAVAVDLIPAQLLENITVEKSMTPDKPGDANGAVVEIRTKSIPDSRFLLVGAQTGFNGNIGPFGYSNSFPDANMGFFGQNVKKQNLTKDYLNLEQDYQARGYSLATGTFINGLQASIANGLIDQAHYNEAQRINTVMEKGFSPYLTTDPAKTGLDQIYDLTYGNRYLLKDGKAIGLILGVNYYNRSTSNPKGQNNLYSVDEPGTASTGYGVPNVIYNNELRLLPIYHLEENTGNHQLNYGGLATLSFRFNPFNEISFTYNGNFGTETNATQEDGASNASLKIPNPNVLPLFPDHQHIYDFILRSTQRDLNSYQLRGEHKFRFVKKWLPWQLSYSGSRSQAHQDDPDYRDTRMRVDSLGRIPNPNPFLPGLYMPSEYQYTYYAESNRYYRNLAETNSNYKADLTIPFKIPHQPESIFKTGGYYYGRRRTYSENLFLRTDNSPVTPNGYGGYSQVQGDLTSLGGNLTAWAGPGNVGIQENGNTTEGQALVPGYLYAPQAGTTMINNVLYVNSYHAKEDVTAFYAMTDLNLTKAWRLIGGVRIENTSFQATQDTTNTNFAALTGIYDKEDFIRNYTTNYLHYNWLPSGSIVYKGIKNVNFRAAYSKTLIRPEMNEIVLSAQRDPIQQLTIYGNKDLKNGVFTNYDFRTDWFIGTEELVSGSVFYKTVVDQLERVYTNGSIDTYGFANSFVSFRNNPNQGQAYGLEFEVRKNLKPLIPTLGQYIFFGGNLLVAHSKTIIDSAEYFIISRVDRSASHTRPLVDQPNFALNLNLDFDYPKWGTQFNVLYNFTGKRLSDINADGSPNIYEYPAPTLDMVFSQKITKRLVFKAFVKNLLNSTTYYRYTDAGNTKTFGVDNQEYIRRAFNYGSVFTFGFKYTL